MSRGLCLTDFISPDIPWEVDIIHVFRKIPDFVESRKFIPVLQNVIASHTLLTDAHTMRCCFFNAHFDIY
jgi:hypothetical protein